MENEERKKLEDIKQMRKRLAKEGKKRMEDIKQMRGKSYR